jgi:hypothetical protein
MFLGCLDGLLPGEDRWKHGVARGLQLYLEIVCHDTFVFDDQNARWGHTFVAWLNDRGEIPQETIPAITDLIANGMPKDAGGRVVPKKAGDPRKRGSFAL